MAKNRMVDTKFWSDKYIANLDPSEKLVFIYLLTNHLTNICGIYEINLKQIGFDTGIDKDMVQKILNRFEKDGKILYRDGWLAIKNWIKHQSDKGNVIKGIESGFSISPKDLVDWVKGLEGPYKDLISTSNYRNPNPNLNPNPNTNGEISAEADAHPQETEIKEKKKPFRVPSLEQCESIFFEQYHEIKNIQESTVESIDTSLAQAASFYDYYSANGWRVGKNPMKDLTATIRNWIRRQSEFRR